MLALLSLSYRSLASSATRWLFTLLAIILGVAGIVATLAINHALTATLDRTARDLLGRADAEVVALDEHGLSATGLEALARVPQVAAAVPRLSKLTYFQAGPRHGFLNLTGIDPQRDSMLHPLTLAGGQALAAGDDTGLLVPASWAADAHLQVGDSIALITRDGFQGFTIRGLVAGGESLVLAGHPAVFVTLDMMRAHFAPGARAGTVSIQYAPGAAAPAPAAIAAALHEPYRLVDVATTVRSLGESRRDFRWLLALFGVVALVGGGLQILNTLAILAHGRARELALLRAAGATRAQVVTILILEALMVGALGSAIGVLLGLLLAGILGSLAAAGQGVDIMGEPFLGPALLGLGAGMLVALLAALAPAWMVGRRSPLETSQPGTLGPAPHRSIALLTLGAAALLAVFGAVIWGLLSSAGETGPFWLLGGFVTALFLGLLLFLTLIMPLFIALAGAVLRGSRAGLGVLAQQSLRWRRGRTALTAGALTIAVALLAMLLVLAASAGASGRTTTRALFAAPYVVVAPVPQPRAILTDVVTTSGAAVASPLRKVALSWDGRYVDAVALDPDFYAQEPDTLPLTAGDRAGALAALRTGDAILVPADFADRYHLAVGAKMNLWTPPAGPVPFTVAGILRRSFPASDPAGALVLSTATLQARYGVDSFTQLLVRPGPADFDVRLRTAAERYGMQARSTADLADSISQAIAGTLLLFSALTGTAALIGALSIINAMSLNVLDRARVIGLLRAAGMTARQVAEEVILEAALIGLFAGTVGVLLGSGLGWLLLGTGRISADTTFAPPGWILLLIPATILLTMAAALWPARRAATTSPLLAVRSRSGH